MPRCFVIQPFDGERFDKRYKDVFAPAIRDADLEPYRVDKDPTTTVVIDDIKREIESSAICLADISTDNANVWFELGYAIASRRNVVMVCSDERDTDFPFDVRHRSIIKYQTQSTQDFQRLQTAIVTKIQALQRSDATVGAAGRLDPVSKLEGLAPHHVAALVSIAANVDGPHSGLATNLVKDAMRKAGFTELAAMLALSALSDKNMVESFEDTGFNHHEQFTAYRLTPNGLGWLVANENTLALRQEDPSNDDEWGTYSSGDDTPEVPF